MEQRTERQLPDLLDLPCVLWAPVYEQMLLPSFIRLVDVVLTQRATGLRWRGRTAASRVCVRCEVRREDRLSALRTLLVSAGRLTLVQQMLCQSRNLDHLLTLKHNTQSTGTAHASDTQSTAITADPTHRADCVSDLLA